MQSHRQSAEWRHRAASGIRIAVAALRSGRAEARHDSVAVEGSCVLDQTGLRFVAKHGSIDQAGGREVAGSCVTRSSGCGDKIARERCDATAGLEVCMSKTWRWFVVVAALLMAGGLAGAAW